MESYHLSHSSTGQSSPVILPPSDHPIYLICGGYGSNPSNAPRVACEIYAIDIRNGHGGHIVGESEDEEERFISSLPKPLRSFTTQEVPLLMGYFMVGDYIYMIGGERMVPDQPGSETSNEVFTYNTKTSELCLLAPMHYAKNNAIIIGPRKIGGKLYFYTIGRRLSFHDFEVYIVKENEDNPCNGQWSKLLQPPVPCFPKRFRSAIETEVYTIIGHTLVDSDGIILISTKNAGVYAYHINKRLWTNIDASAVLPFCFGASFIPSMKLFFGFSPSAGIIAISASKGLNLVVRKLLSGKFRQHFNSYLVNGLHPVFEEPLYGRALAFITPLSNGMVCLVRSCTDESTLNQSNEPRMLVAVSVCTAQLLETEGVVNAAEFFSNTYILDESTGLKNVFACLSPLSGVAFAHKLKHACSDEFRRHSIALKSKGPKMKVSTETKCVGCGTVAISGNNNDNKGLITE